MLKKLLKRAPEIPQERMKELLLFQAGIKQQFKNISLLDNALTHSSFANESKDHSVVDNERLEFLGDSVLSLSVSEYLYENVKGNEGFYTKTRSVVVSEFTLAKIARSINIDKYIKIGHGEEQSGGRNKNAILADCMEAVLASVYLDRGFEAAKSFILDLLIPEIELVLADSSKKDYKTLLQEYVQKKYKIVPVYELEKTSGPEHDQEFFFTVKIKNKVSGSGSGHNKKEAEQNAAKDALVALGLEN